MSLLLRCRRYGRVLCKPYLFLIVGSMLLLQTSCITPAVLSTPDPTAAPDSVITATAPESVDGSLITPEQTSAPVLAATPTTVIHPEGGWQEYTNPSYGFLFQYPPGWSLVEITDPNHTLYEHAIWLFPPGNAEIRMQIAFRRHEEELRLMRTGVGAGELFERGSVLFLGSEITRNVLVLDEKDMTILYGSGEIPRNDLRFMMFLDYLGSPMNATALTDDVEASADAIIASLHVVNRTELD